MRLSVLILMMVGLIGDRAMAVEEPSFDVLAVGEGYEIRRYSPYLVAETTVSGDIRRADNSGFRILAGYIFGNNRQRAPMTTTRSSEKVSQKIAMTAPVLTTVPDTDEPSRYVYSFVMPAEHTLDSLPIPMDGSIRFRRVPSHIVAVRRYSGRWQQARYEKHAAILKDALQADGIDTVGEPILARYNAPFVPGFLRRNEVMVELAGVELDQSIAAGREPADVTIH